MSTIEALSDNILFTDRERPPYPLTRRLFGWMLGHDPKEMVQVLEFPTLALLPYRVENYARRQADSPLVILSPRSMWNRHIGQAVDTLAQGVHDVARTVCLALATQDGELKNAVKTQNDSYIEILAGIAGLPTREVDVYFHVQRRRLQEGKLNMEKYQTDAYEVVQEDSAVDPMRGCPFARLEEPQLKRDPLFRSFANWATATTLAVIEENLGHTDVSPETAYGLAGRIYS